MTLTVEFKGLKLVVSGNYNTAERGSYYTPPIPETFEITEVLYNDSDIHYVLLAFNAIDELEELCLDHV